VKVGNVTALAAVVIDVQPGDRFYAEGIKGVDSSRTSNEGTDLGTGTFYPDILRGKTAARWTS